MYQHDETGCIGFIDKWQVENDFEKYNPRLKIIKSLYATPPPAMPVLGDDRLAQIAEGCMDNEDRQFLLRRFITAVDAERGLLSNATPAAPALIVRDAEHMQAARKALAELREAVELCGYRLGQGEGFNEAWQLVQDKENAAYLWLLADVPRVAARQRTLLAKVRS